MCNLAKLGLQAVTHSWMAGTRVRYPTKHQSLSLRQNGGKNGCSAVCMPTIHGCSRCSTTVIVPQGKRSPAVKGHIRALRKTPVHCSAGSPLQRFQPWSREDSPDHPQQFSTHQTHPSAAKPDESSFSSGAFAHASSSQFMSAHTGPFCQSLASVAWLCSSARVIGSWMVEFLYPDPYESCCDDVIQGRHSHLPTDSVSVTVRAMLAELTPGTDRGWQDMMSTARRHRQDRASVHNLWRLCQALMAPLGSACGSITTQTRPEDFWQCQGPAKYVTAALPCPRGERSAEMLGKWPDQDSIVRDVVAQERISSVQMAACVLVQQFRSLQSCIPPESQAGS